VLIMKLIPAPLVFHTSARMAKIMQRNVFTTAASCGLRPKGAATAKENDARTRPRRTCSRTINAPEDSVKMRARQVIPTMSHAGR
jgi:hypothetical protein